MRTIKTVLSIIMLMNGIFFISNIYVLGNTDAAVKMHKDLIPTASAFIANAKVVICFVTGILYLISVYGFFRNKYNLLITGVIGFIIFFGFYIIELLLWGKTYSNVWFGFSIFGVLSLIFGIYSFILWNKRETV